MRAMGGPRRSRGTSPRPPPRDHVGQRRSFVGDHARNGLVHLGGIDDLVTDHAADLGIAVDAALVHDRLAGDALAQPGDRLYLQSPYDEIVLVLTEATVTVDHDRTITFGESTEFSTRAPETTVPGDTIELMACPIRPCQPFIRRRSLEKPSSTRKKLRPRSTGRRRQCPVRSNGPGRRRQLHREAGHARTRGYPMSAAGGVSIAGRVRSGGAEVPAPGARTITDGVSGTWRCPVSRP